MQFLHVLNDNLGQFNPRKALRHLHIAILVHLAGIEIGLNGRCGRAQQYPRAHLVRQDDGRVAGVVARGRVLLLITLFVLFVHDDETQILEGQEDGRAHADHEGEGRIGQLLLPEFHTLGIGEFAMIDAHLVAKHAPQSGRQLSGQGNLGHQVEHLSTRFQFAADEFGIHFGFSARSHAVQEADAVRAPCLGDFAHGALLLLVECAAQGFGQGVARLQAEAFGGEGLNPTFRSERHEGRIAEARQGSQLPLRHRRSGRQQCDGRCLRQTEFCQKQGHHVQLSRGALQALQHFRKALGRKKTGPRAQMCLRARLVGACQPFLHDNGPHLHQPLEVLQHRGSACRLAFHDSLQRHCLIVAQQVVDGQPTSFELSHEVGIAANEHLALHLEPRWQGGLHHLAHSAHIIIGQPLPEP